MRLLLCSSRRIQSPQCDLFVASRRLLVVQWKIRLYSTSPPSWDSRSPPPCPYKVLGIEENAPWKTVRKAYILLAKQLHPDAASISAAAPAAARQPAVAAHTTSAKIGRRDGQAGAAAAAAREGSNSAGGNSYFGLFFSYLGGQKQRLQSPSAARTFEDIQWAYEMIKTQLKQQQKRQQNTQERFHSSGAWVDWWATVDKRDCQKGTAARERGSGVAAAKQQQKHVRDEALKEWLATQKAAATFWKKKYATNDTIATAAAAAPAAGQRAVPYVATTVVADSSTAVDSAGTPPQPPTAAAAAAASSVAAASRGAVPHQQAGETEAFRVRASSFEEAFKRRLQAEKQFSSPGIPESSPNASDGVYGETDEDGKREREHRCTSELHRILAKVRSAQKHITLLKHSTERQEYAHEAQQCDTDMQVGIKEPCHDTKACAARRREQGFAGAEKGNSEVKRSLPKADMLLASTCGQEYERDRQQHIRDLQRFGFSEDEIRSAAHVLGVFPSRQKSAERCSKSGKWCSHQERKQQLLCAFFLMLSALFGAWSLQHRDRRRHEHTDIS